MTKKFLVLSYLEDVNEIINGNDKNLGFLTLIQYHELFYLRWTRIENSKFKGIPSLTTLETLQKELFNDQKWKENEQFFILTNAFEYISFQQKVSESKTIEFSIKKREESVLRTFKLSSECDVSLALFLEQLLKYGIAVPSLTGCIENCKYNLFFYKNSYIHTCQAHPSHIQIKTDEFQSLDELWNRVLDYYSQLIIYLNSAESMPIDNDYPLKDGAQAVHIKIMEKIHNDIDQKLNEKQYEDITEHNYKDIFDDNGKIIDPDLFKARLFHANLDQKLLTYFLPFILGVYPLTSTLKEREELDNEMKEVYKVLELQLNILQQSAVDHNEKLKGFLDTIKKDVDRTDKTNDAFRDDNSIGCQILTKFLKMYVLYNPPISYLQGMNDLLVPIITAYFPKWDQDGHPIDENGNRIDDYEKNLPIMFWCFDAMLKNTRHTELLQDVPLVSKQIAEEVISLLSKISPLCEIWLSRNSLSQLEWCYSVFVLLFKRTFTKNIWYTWLRFNTATLPGKFLVLFVTAIILEDLILFSNLKDISVPSIIKNFNDIVTTNDSKLYSEIANWITDNYMTDYINQYSKLQKEEEENHIKYQEQLDNCEFFKPLCKQ